ncbi:MAG: hypothetical protein HC780_14120 [Leptolyngbyaceae cyanobacterium CSU_1_3]|nr:hypothetical protein [Leptolyngbyaceae cyanobacterium CSU_1_3]
MEFRPFWELLEELGIDLPDPSRIKAQENRKPIEPPPPPPSATQSRDRVLQYLGELIEDCTIAGRNAWVPADQTVQVGNYSLPGLVYVGNGLMSLRSYTHVEPCLIRPKLKIDCPHPDYAGKQMHYSPSYQEMKPASRAAYLEWLSQGRRTPKTYIGYVWLFFMG